MKKYFVLALLFPATFLLVHSQYVLADNENISQNSNPLLGTWEWTNIKNSCNETYIFANDGSSHITSGTETSTASYVLSEKPLKKGFIK